MTNNENNKQNKILFEGVNMENEKMISEQPAVVQNEPQNTVEIKENAPKKKFRIGWFILSIVPVFATLVLQSLALTPFMLLATFDLIEAGADTSNTIDFADQLMKIYGEKYATYGLILYGIAAIVVFGIWYSKAYVKKNPKVSLKEVFGVKSVVAAVVSVVSLQFIIYAGMIAINALFPHAFDAYNNMMNSVGLGNDVLLTVVYGIILAPIAEELAVRGLSFGYLNKSGLKPVAAILVSALLFGFMHLNLVQGVYTFLFGVVLAFLRYKYRSVMISIVAHICFNFFGSYGIVLFEKLGFNETAFYILGAVSVAVLVFCFFIVKSDKKAFKGVAA